MANGKCDNKEDRKIKDLATQALSVLLQMEEAENEKLESLSPNKSRYRNLILDFASNVLKN